MGIQDNKPIADAVEDSQSCLGHTPFAQQARNTLSVGIRPGAFGTTRCKAPCIGILVDAPGLAVNPSKAQRLFYRLLVGNACFSRSLLVVDQPDFLVVAMVFC